MRAGLFFLLLFILVTTPNTRGQGCSDAGFCTVSDLKPGAFDSTSVFLNQLKIGISNGVADHSISIIAPYMEYNRQLNNFVLNAKITALSQKGNGMSSFGFSDIFLTSNYKFSKTIKALLGIKIPLSDGNNQQNGLPLPMDYQSSLGTFDLIAGLGFIFNNFESVVAIQQPLTQNKNTFVAEAYPEHSAFSNFQSTKNYERKGDLLLRISYLFNINKEFTITPGLLSIYHINNDKYTAGNGDRKEIAGSEGLTLNGVIYFDYSINEISTLQLSFGTPLVSRDVRPDGLTRKYILNLEYGFKF